MPGSIHSHGRRPSRGSSGEHSAALRKTTGSAHPDRLSSSCRFRRYSPRRRRRFAQPDSACRPPRDRSPAGRWGPRLDSSCCRVEARRPQHRRRRRAAPRPPGAARPTPPTRPGRLCPRCPAATPRERSCDRAWRRRRRGPPHARVAPSAWEVAAPGVRVSDRSGATPWRYSDGAGCAEPPAAGASRGPTPGATPARARTCAPSVYNQTGAETT